MSTYRPFEIGLFTFGEIIAHMTPRYIPLVILTPVAGAMAGR